MPHIYSNGPTKNYVYNAINTGLSKSSTLYVAVPFFSECKLIKDAIAADKMVKLLVGLNSATNPKALDEVLSRNNVDVRYFTYRFHAKIYLVDDGAIIGSANMTDAGLHANREVVMCLNGIYDNERIEELKELFNELWNSAKVLTPEKLEDFKRVHKDSYRTEESDVVEQQIGRSEPWHINVESQRKSQQRPFVEELRRKIHEQYKPAFDEVTEILNTHSLRRTDLYYLESEHETNRFLNWVRLNYVVGDETWQTAPLLSEKERKSKVVSFAQEWKNTTDTKIPERYVQSLETVRRIFASQENIEAATKEEIMEGLLSLHAFVAQFRFFKGGIEQMPQRFWENNGHDVEKVKKTVIHLLYGGGDLAQRLHDVLYDQKYQVKNVAKFCALELYGDIKPQEYPPINGRMAKALRYLGFDVPGT